MAAVKGRKHGGVSGRTELVRGYVREEIAGTADDIATRAGISFSAYLDLALEYAMRQMDQEDLPTWLPHEHRKHPQLPELPMTG